MPKKTPASPSAIALADLPRIGTMFHGGLFVGIAAGAPGEPDNAIIVLADDTGKGMTWKKAMAWAESLAASLPTRDEAAICYANGRAIFAREWHWTSTQSAGYEGYAWCQYFSYGNQDDTRKGTELRARAVRRLPIQ